MPDVEIVAEQERRGGWTFSAQVLADDGSLHRRQLRLSWADYDHWSRGGTATPADVARAVLLFLVRRLAPSEVRESFDASLARRLFDDADTAIPTLIG